ncbi:MAG: DUF2203 family protein [Gammaproteobacteria bacterium]|nr:DUF2203 family protein [Gammaproteobacteria bacterium]
MSQKNKGRFPTRKKNYSLAETNSYIPYLEKSFLRLRQLNESVSIVLSDLGIDTDDLSELDLLKNTDDRNESTYLMLTDLKLYLSAIQNTVRELSETGCLIDNLDQGKVAWPAEKSSEIFWSFGDKQCQLIATQTEIENEIYLVPNQVESGTSATPILNED